MRARSDDYVADKGKYFVLTEKGKQEIMTFRLNDEYVVGKPVSDNYYDQTHPYKWQVEDDYLEEVDDPDYVVMPGYQVVYDYKGHQICCGNSYVFHDKEMAERYRDKYAKTYACYGWDDHKPYIITAVYEGKRPVPNKEYKGKTLFVEPNWFGDVGCEGDFVEEKIVDWFLNCVPPRTFTSGMIQCGEPASSCVEGMTYSTFVKVDEDVWEYKGDCLAGTTKHGTPIPVVM